eukprot:gene14659-20693_t
MRFFPASRLLLCALAVVSAVQHAHAEAVVKPQTVIDLDTKNFDGVVGKSSFAMVMFYSPTCGHCINMKPKYMEASDYWKARDSTILFAGVDVMNEPDLGQKFGIRGFPTLKWFVDGELHSEFKGGKETDDFIKYVRERTVAKTNEVNTVEELTKLEDHPAVLVAWFPALEGKECTTFAKLSVKMEAIRFVETTSKEVGAAVGITNFDAPAAVMVRNFPEEERELAPLDEEERELAPLDGKLTRLNLVPFINAQKLMPVTRWLQTTAARIFDAGIPKHILLWSKGSDLTKDSPMYKTFQSVAKDFRGQLAFIAVDNELEDATPITTHFQFVDSPTVLGIEMQENKKFKFMEALTEDNLRKFATSFLNDELAAYYKSEPIPEAPEDKENMVQIVVGESFTTITEMPGKDVFLMGYHTEDKGCMELMPIWEKLAARFSNIDSVVIAKLDAGKNEHVDLSVPIFPTILFYPASDEKLVIPYISQENRTLTDFTKFVKKYAKVPFFLPRTKKGKEGKDEL